MHVCSLFCATHPFLDKHKHCPRVNVIKIIRNKKNKIKKDAQRLVGMQMGFYQRGCILDGSGTAGHSTGTEEPGGGVVWHATGATIAAVASRQDSAALDRQY